MRFVHTFDLHSFGDSAVSLLSAFVFGVLIGAERQYRQRTAGIRTNALVALGGAAFVDLAQRLAGDVESLRVIAYVVSGIGFLGAGAIIKEGVSVRGMNTAATLWCSAAVGACCGSDMLAEGALLTFFVIAGNTVLRPLVRTVDSLPVRSEAIEATYALDLEIRSDATSEALADAEDALSDSGYTIRRMTVLKTSDSTTHVGFALLPGEHDPDTLHKIAGILAAKPAVLSVSWCLNSES
jgi:putative Mg2+ transporter-C (MgtC) family protein